MPSNRPPVFIGPLGRSLAEDDPARAIGTGFLLPAFIDPDPGDTLTLLAINGVAAGPIRGRLGTLAWDVATGGYTYSLDNSLGAVQRLGAGETARERFDILVSDASGAVASGPLIVTIAGANDAPQGRSFSLRLSEDAATPLAVTLLTGAQDADVRDVLRIASVNGSAAPTVDGAYGSLTWNAETGAASYRLATNRADIQALRPGEFLWDRFSFVISDGKGGTDTETLTVRVTGANDAPRGDAVGYLPFSDDGSIPGVSLFESVFDPDGHAVTLSAVRGSTTPGVVEGRYGDLTWAADGSASYVPVAWRAALRALGAGQAAEDVFDVTFTDELGARGTVKVSFGVVGVDDPARIGGTTTGAVEEDGVGTASGRLIIKDPDPGQARFALPASLAGTLGVFTLDALTGDWTYVLDQARAQPLKAGQVVTESLAVQSFDGSTMATIRVTVTGTDSLPVAVADTYRVAKDQALTVTTGPQSLLANDTGGDPALTAQAGLYGTAQPGGAVEINADGSFTYTPPPGFVGTDSFTYTLFDVDGDTTIGTATVTVTPTQPPISLRDVGLGFGGFAYSNAGQDALVGWSVAGLGNVNYDGVPDLLLGAPQEDTAGRWDNGAAYLIFGRAGPASHNLANIADAGFDNGAGGVRIIGEQSGDRAGQAVAAAGDVNADGFADMIVLASRNSSDGAQRNGAVYVVFGGALGEAPTDQYIDLRTIAAGQGGFKILGEETDEGDWMRIAGPGDVNGDGRADILVGVGARDARGGPDSGSAYVVFGRSGGAPTDLDDFERGAAGFRITGAAPGDLAGYSVSGAGDVNGDGLADLLVAAPQADFPGLYDAGAAYVVFGRSGATEVRLDQVSQGVGGFVIRGAVAGELAGYAVAGAGDVNGDGRPDLIVSAPFASSAGRTQNGTVYVVFSREADPAVQGSANTDLAAVAAGQGGFRIIGQTDYDLIGVSVAGAGDINGDGLADILIGATNGDVGGLSTNGAAYLVYGKAGGGTVDLNDVARGLGGFKITGAGEGDRAGTAVAAVGDVGGDARPDLLIGAPYANAASPNAFGAAYVVTNQPAWSGDPWPA